MTAEPKVETRPWGSYIVLEEAKTFKIKRVTINTGENGKINLHIHLHRNEHWVIVSGTAEVEIDGETKLLIRGESTYVKNGTPHQLKNPGIIPLEVIEIQIGGYLTEDDNIYFDDDYVRETAAV
jgi:mannose-1-phosphate guanylyltransferase/mannose-6-phosphate isomerase